MADLREMPDVGSKWVFPGWNNPDYTGPWTVVAVGPPGEESFRAVHLVRDEDGRRTDSDVNFWPGGWEPHR